MQKLGQQKKSIELAVPNVELAWKIDDVFMQRANAYTQLMFENKQIRQMPDLSQLHHQAVHVAQVDPGDRLERAGHGASGSDAAGRDRKRPQRLAAAGVCSKDYARSRSGVGFPAAARRLVGPRGRHYRHAAGAEPARGRA